MDKVLDLRYKGKLDNELTVLFNYIAMDTDS